jgi:hypothetical protein
VAAQCHRNDIGDIDDGGVAEVRVTMEDNGNPLEDKRREAVWEEEGEIRGGEWWILKSQPKIVVIKQPEQDIFDSRKR